MPIGVDLGFSCVVLAVLVFSAVGFVARWKWRLSVARREEIRRLLELAAEEAARAELEASAGYVTSPSAVAPISLRVQYHQCAVCFSPAATRCSRCKAVRYCSGKCQIVHWRQGHREECQPFTTSYQNDTGAAPSQLLRQGNEIHGNGIENVERQYAGCIHSISKESRFSKSDCHSEVFGRNDDSQVEHFLDGEGVDSSLHETERSDRKQSVNAIPVELKINHIKTTELMEQTQVIHPDKFDDIKSGYTRSNPSTSSSGAGAGGSNGPSFSEPCTPSSGFWDKTIDFRKTKLEACDDSSQSGSSDAGDTDMPTSRAPPKFFFSCNVNNVPPVDGQNFLSKVVMSDGGHSPNFASKKPIHRALSSEEKSDNASEGEGSPLLIHEKSDQMGVYSRDGSSVSKDMEPQSCTPSTISYSNPSPKGHPVDVCPSKSSEFLSSSPKRSNGVVGETSSSLHPLQSEEGGSLKSSASIAHSSTTRTHSLQGANSLEVGSANATGVSDYGSHTSNPRNGKKIVDELKASKSSSHHQSAVGSEIAGAGRYTDKGLFSYDMFVKLYNWNKIDLRPTGLTNCGNSCYANAVLQCLAWTPPLTAYLLQGLHSKECKKKEWCFTCEFESLILKSKKGISPLSPIGILSQTQKLGSYLGNGREEDAHEFLRASIDNMQSVCLKDARVSVPSSFEEETTLVGLTFGGYLRSKIKCMRCGGKSERHERMMDLTVEIEGNIGTLEAALRKFTGTEILDDENKYKCSRCRSYEKAKKKLKVQETPNVLTIALKRFQSGKFGKLNKSIQFPEILDLAPYMSGTSDKSPIYKLYGVVVHLDVMNATFSGHYVCYVKNLQNKWFKVDDSVVTAVEREDVLSKKAYMLFYARCSPRAPRSLRNSIIPLELRKPKHPLFKLRSCSTGPWDDPANRHNGVESLYHQNYSNFHHSRRILEDDYLSENSSSVFSEVRSCSTESSNKDSSSTDEFFDHVLGDTDQNWNNMWKHSSDSDSSSSSSSSSPPPLFKQSPLSDFASSSSGKPETNDQQVQSAGPNEDGNSFWVSKISSLNSCTAKESRKLDSNNSSSSRETDSERLVWANAFGNGKPGLSFRKSTRERGD